MVVAGVVTYYVVHRELSDEHIVVSDDAKRNAGEDVEGPFTAYSEAMVIKTHALEIGDGKTYAELPSDDPAREDVMNASFLRSSLFTSVVAFGVAALVVGLGFLFVLVGVALLSITKRLSDARGGDVTPEPAAPALAYRYANPRRCGGSPLWYIRAFRPRPPSLRAGPARDDAGGTGASTAVVTDERNPAVSGNGGHACAARSRACGAARRSQSGGRGRRGCRTRRSPPRTRRRRPLPPTRDAPQSSRAYSCSAWSSKSAFSRYDHDGRTTNMNQDSW